MKLSIIIPVFNEEMTVEEILKKVKLLKLPNKLRKEIIVINDGSSDKTKKMLAKIKKIRLFHHKKNRGKGAAVKTGLNHATGHIVAIQDADLEYDPKDLLRLVNPIINNKSWVCFGTRLKDYPLKLFGKNRTILPSHWVANRTLSYLTNLIYGSKLSDMETCYKVFKREVLEDVELKSKRFDFEPEITAKILKKGYQILEIPIKVKPRTKKEGKKIGWKDGIFAIKALIKYRFVD